MKLDVQTLDAKKAGSVDLDDAIFGIKEIRADILQRMVKYQLAKRRAGTHKTQSRGEVSRSHSKLYKQKGTGQARHGAANAPIFRTVIGATSLSKPCKSSTSPPRRRTDALSAN